MVVEERLLACSLLGDHRATKWRVPLVVVVECGRSVGWWCRVVVVGRSGGLAVGRIGVHLPPDRIPF